MKLLTNVFAASALSTLLASASFAGKLVLESGYLSADRGATTITIPGGVVVDGAAVTVHQDGNNCSVDRYGNPDMCTEAAYPHWDATLRLAGENDQGQEIYYFKAQGRPRPLALVKEGDAYKVVFSRILPTDGLERTGSAYLRALQEDQDQRQQGQEAIIKDVEVTPDNPGINPGFFAYVISGKVKLGSNPCHAAGRTAKLVSQQKGDKIVVTGYIASNLNPHMGVSCPAVYNPVYAKVSIRVDGEQSKISEISVANVDDKGEFWSFPIGGGASCPQFLNCMPPYGENSPCRTLDSFRRDCPNTMITR